MSEISRKCGINLPLFNRSDFRISSQVVVIRINGISVGQMVVVIMVINGKPNRLIDEKSPYLRQHAFNPVDWYPWGDEAFRKAEEENKPIFLSIGYSTCHWCHVMERESFQDPDTAELLNDAFVCIKVDREERPDIDGIYMDVCQLMTGKGGWPLSIIMTPEKKPFFSATYIPRDRRFGHIGLRELVPEMRKMWLLRRSEAMMVSRQIARAVGSSPLSEGDYVLDDSVADRAFAQLSARYDAENGGFGGPPKFPSPHNLIFLLRYWKRTANEAALSMVENTLQKMARGGIYDHAGSGFHRYSTDARWLVPHFEKMLYDQAMLSMAYIEAFAATGRVYYRDIAEAVFTYVLRDMTSPEGVFYSAEDADSEGREGKYYLWTKDELIELLGSGDAALISELYGVNEEGNFRDESTGQITGESILHLEESLDDIAIKRNTAPEELRGTVRKLLDRLYEARNARIHPFKDDKVMTDWNGLMIAALAKGGRVFGEKRYIEAAERAVSFLLKEHLTGQVRLLHRSREGKASIRGILDDYAFLIWALIELYEATYRIEYLKKALDLTDTVVRLFWDAEKGGFFFTAHDGEELLARKKELYDGAYPSGNSVMMMNLILLSLLTGRKELEDKADKMARAFSGSIVHSPVAYTHSMSALLTAIGPSFRIVVSSGDNDEVTEGMLKLLRTSYIPESVVIYRNGAESDMTALYPYTAGQKPIGGKTTAYVCSSNTCTAPVGTLDALRAVLLQNLGGGLR